MIINLYDNFDILNNLNNLNNLDDNFLHKFHLNLSQVDE